MYFGASAREAAPGAAEEVDAVIDFCAREQLGMPYAEHAASLTVGAAVTWTSTLSALKPERSGTIVKIFDNGNLQVEGASTGKRGTFTPAKLRLAQAQINVYQVPSSLRALPSPREPAGEVRSADRGG